MSDIARVTFTAVGYPGISISAMMNEDKPRLSGGIAKYNSVGIPHRRDGLEFDSEDPLVQNFGVMFDAFPDGEVEGQLRQLYGWAAKSSLDEPPVVHISGPLSYTDLPYKITKITDEGELERRDDGLRCRQELKIELTEWVAIDIVVANTSPAAAAAAAAPTYTSVALRAATSDGTYTVVRGDTLSGIAHKRLGNASRWPEIAAINNVRDPRTIKPGQVLRLPS